MILLLSMGAPMRAQAMSLTLASAYAEPAGVRCNVGAEIVEKLCRAFLGALLFS